MISDFRGQCRHMYTCFRHGVVWEGHAKEPLDMVWKFWTQQQGGQLLTFPIIWFSSRSKPKSEPSYLVGLRPRPMGARDSPIQSQVSGYLSSSCGRHQTSRPNPLSNISLRTCHDYTYNMYRDLYRVWVYYPTTPCIPYMPTLAWFLGSMYSHILHDIAWSVWVI